MTNLHDARVEAAARALFHDPLASGDFTWDEMVAEDNSRAETWRDDARRVLAAADAVTECLCYGADGVTEPKCPHCIAADAVVTVEPARVQLAAQRKIGKTARMVDMILDQANERGVVVEVVYPSPTVEMIAEVVSQFWADTDTPEDVARAVLALIRGGGEQ